MSKDAGVFTIDCQYLRPGFAAAYLLVQGGGAAFVDDNTARAVPLMLAALDEHGLSPEDVEFVIVTHAHLDHAGGSSALLEACPRAKLIAHPRAAPHLIDPARLLASARTVYGEDAFAQLYGEIKPIPAERVRAMADGEKLEWRGRTLSFLHTRGHANHHFCVLDPAAGAIFTGDAFGLAYPRLQARGLFVLPSTSPTDFDPAEARLSLRKIVETGAQRAFLTHFGQVDELEEAARQLGEHLDASERILNEAELEAERGVSRGELGRFCRGRLETHYEAYLAGRGADFRAEAMAFLQLDLELNGDGIAHIALKRADKRKSSPGAS